MSLAAVRIISQLAASNFVSCFFVWLPWKVATSNFALSNFRGRSWFFRLEPFETSFENLMTFHRKVARIQDEFQWISFALLLHNTVLPPRLPLPHSPNLYFLAKLKGNILHHNGCETSFKKDMLESNIDAVAVIGQKERDARYSRY